MIINILRNYTSAASTSLSYVTEEAGRLYFGKVREIKSKGGVSGIFAVEPSQIISKQKSRVKVIDIPSIADKEVQKNTVSAVLEEVTKLSMKEWAKALFVDKDKDNRIPTFIVVDEAHNLIPKEPTSITDRVLLSQFRTVAAEGRKYGLYLIVVTQRPDKIDQHVLSECGNKAVMRMNSQNLLHETSKLLGMDDISKRELDKCLTFKTGRAMLAGDWVNRNKLFQLVYCASRRTAEGGRNLRPQHWAVIEEKELNVKKKKASKKKASKKIATKIKKRSIPKRRR